MKTTVTLKKSTAVSSGAGIDSDTKAPASSGSAPRPTSNGSRRFAVQQVKPEEEFREMLRRRETTPFVSAIPYHRWGLNE